MIRKLLKKLRHVLLILQKTSYRWYHKFGFNENTRVIIVAFIIGVTAGFGAVGIHYGIEFFEDLFWASPDLSVDYYHSVPWYIKLLSPALAGLAVGLIIHFVSSEAKGHGVPEVMAAIALRNGVIRKRVAAAKLLASSIYIGGGGSVGREGPVIQIGSAVGSVIGQMFRFDADNVKTFVACGAAAGIAAAFNAPIAGTLFSAEIILGNFAVARLSPVVISAVGATAVSQAILGNETTFSVPEYSMVSLYEFLPYLLLGLLSGLVALMFIKTLHTSETWFEKLPIPIYVKTLAGGIAIGGIGCFIPHIYGVGYDTIDNMMHGNLPWTVMTFLIFAKIAATSMSLGSGGSGGVFAPSLFLGAATGGAFGEIVHQFFPAITAPSGAYALIGMGAVVAATTHAPIAAVLIIFEMTNDYNIILPLMLASIVALVFRASIFKESIYTIKLVARGIHLDKGKDRNVLRSIPVKEIIDHKVAKISADTPFASLLENVLDRPHFHYIVVDKSNNFIGIISLREVQQALQEKAQFKSLIIAHDLANIDAPRLYESETLDVAMGYFGQYQLDVLPVFKTNGGAKVIGQISLKDAMDAYNSEISKIDVSTELTSSIKEFDQTKNFDFVEGHSLAEIRTPPQLSGKSLVELNLRKEYGIHVIFIKRKRSKGKELSIVPTPADILCEGDKLVVLGPDDAVAEARRRLR